MLTVYVLLISALVFETAALLTLLRLFIRLSRSVERLRTDHDARLSALAAEVESLTDEGGDDSVLAESRRKAVEAERRFTEGVANILSFSYQAAGRKGE